jgi:hypothetical protein
MSKAGQLVAMILFFALAAMAGNTCPVILVNGAGESNAFSITFRNAGKLPIRRIEFNCSLVPAKVHQSQRIPCYEDNALFFPGTEYTVSYPYPGGIPKPVLVSLKSVTSANGYIWKPSRRQPCRAVHIVPARTRNSMMKLHP